MEQRRVKSCRAEELRWHLLKNILKKRHLASWVRRSALACVRCPRSQVIIFREVSPLPSLRIKAGLVLSLKVTNDYRAVTELKVLLGFRTVVPFSVSLTDSSVLANSPPSLNSLSIQVLSRWTLAKNIKPGKPGTFWIFYHQGGGGGRSAPKLKIGPKIKFS